MGIRAIYTNQNYYRDWVATDDNYCGAPDSNSIVGRGNTEIEAIEDYIEEYKERMNIDK